jgi:hypothetical protein
VIGDNDFRRWSDRELGQAYLESIQARTTTEHVGRINRLFGLGGQIIKELKTRGTARLILEQLAQHCDPHVRAAAQWQIEHIDRPSKPALPLPPPRSEYLWQCDHPPPVAMTREDVVQRMRSGLPDHCDRLVDLMRPAIGLWPLRWHEGIAPTASRLGGRPLAPPGWRWPTVEDEPLLFVGQINCSELEGFLGAELLPSSGLLVFFADHDAVQACRVEASADIAVYHWTERELAPAVAPVERVHVFPECALAFRAMIDLPDPFSRAIESLGLNEEDTMLYTAEWREIRRYGIPYCLEPYVSFSKLLGWPALVQWHDLDTTIFSGSHEPTLLLQIDEYCNGEEVQSWADAGSLYFLLSERDLRAANFMACSFDIQFT